MASTPSDMPARNGKTRRNDRRHDKLAEALAPLVRDRDLGLVTQAEYEARLEDVRAALEPDQTLVESDLPGRTTRFALRSLRTGATLARFDFRAEP